MSNAKHYEWLFVNILEAIRMDFRKHFRRKVVNYSLFGFEGSNLRTK